MRALLCPLRELCFGIYQVRPILYTWDLGHFIFAIISFTSVFYVSPLTAVSVATQQQQQCVRVSIDRLKNQNGHLVYWCRLSRNNDNTHTLCWSLLLGRYLVCPILRYHIPGSVLSLRRQSALSSAAESTAAACSIVCINVSTPQLMEPSHPFSPSAYQGRSLEWYIRVPYIFTVPYVLICHIIRTASFLPAIYAQTPRCQTSQHLRTYRYEVRNRYVYTSHRSRIVSM